MSTVTTKKTLTALDRCDRCGAQAYIRAVLQKSGKDLLFCAHHAREHEGKLKSLVSIWQDESNKISKQKNIEPNQSSSIVDQ